MTNSFISFDIFDTLLLRPYTNPQELWEVLEEREGSRGFAKARKKADAITYKRASNRGGETSIEEAYCIMPKKFRGLMIKEMELEREVLCANPEMHDFWKKAGEEGKTRILISDMYLPKDFIESILVENGFEGWDKFYLSREYDRRKTTGDLYKVVLDDLKIKPSELLHIGDNEYSDIKIPASIGINTKHYPKVTDSFFEECPFAKQINQRLAGSLALGWHEFKHKHPNYTYWNRLGFTMGGILGYMYVSWIVKTAKDLGKDRLLFVARDGYIWKNICNKLYPEIKTDYIYAPRITSIAVLGAIGNDPNAIADRQRYIDENLQGVNVDAIKKEYTAYITQYDIDDKCAIVDGCSSGFSAQRLIETCVNKKVFCFYLLAMADFYDAAALYKSGVHVLQFQQFCEFLFGSPELPIHGVKDGIAVYTNECSDEELFKMSVSEEISKGALICALRLFKDKIHISPDDWISFSDAFMNNLTESDYENLSNAKNAADVQQKQFYGVIWKPRRKGKTLIKRAGRFSLEITIYKSHSVIRYQISIKGLIKKVIAEYQCQNNS